MSTLVITYQLAYRLHIEVTLCAECVKRDDHDLGSLGPVSHGAHRGECESPRHAVSYGVIDDLTPNRATVIAVCNTADAALETRTRLCATGNGAGTGQAVASTRQIEVGQRIHRCDMEVL